MRAVYDDLENEYRLAREWGHYERAAAYRGVLQHIRKVVREASAQQSTMSNFEHVEE